MDILWTKLHTEKKINNKRKETASRINTYALGKVLYI